MLIIFIYRNFKSESGDFSWYQPIIVLRDYMRNVILNSTTRRNIFIEEPAPV